MDSKITSSHEKNIRWSVLLLSAVLCVVQALLTIYDNDILKASLTGSLLAPFAFAMLLILVLVVNPILGHSRFIRPLNRAELLSILFALLVTSGVSRAGLTTNLVPLIVAPHNPNWNTPQRGWSERVIPQLNPDLYIDDQETITKFNKGWGPITETQASDEVTMTKPPAAADWGQKVAYWRSLFRTIPWDIWARPLAYWMIFVIGFYGVFYCLSLTVLDYWSRREKLIFPHVRLAEAVLPAANQSASRFPPFCRSSYFWWGFGIVFVYVGWQVVTNMQWLGSLKGIPRGINSAQVNAIFEGTLFEGLGGPPYNYGFSVTFSFLAIGIAFLISTEISFSIWFYYLAVKAMMLLAVWLGYGQTMADFPADNLWHSNPISALGGGALFLFGGVCLYRSVADYLRQSSGRPWREKISVMRPPLALAGFMLVLVGWLSWNELSTFWSMFLVGTLTLLSLSLMRLVAEVGIPSFHLYVGFFHVYMAFGLGRFLSPLITAAILPICAVFFLYYWTAIGPNFLNANKARTETGASSARFHLNLIGCVAITAVVSIAFVIFMAYLNGANSKHPWFYNRVPQQIFDEATNLISSKHDMDLSNAFWYSAGAAWTCASMILRRTLFWLPHPIGCIMLASIGISSLWFSFLIGWTCKKLAVTYGGRATFDRIRLFFVGLVIGELVSYASVHMLGMIMNRHFGIQQ